MKAEKAFFKEGTLARVGAYEWIRLAARPS